MNIDETLITVIVPVFNVEKYLQKCIDSIVMQTYRNMQIILINDGSMDKSGDICDSYSKNDSRIMVIHQENQGVSVARNNAMNAALGHWIAFVDGDDWLEIDMLEQLYDIAKNYDADILFCNYYINYPSAEKKRIYFKEEFLSFTEKDKEDLQLSIIRGKLHNEPSVIGSPWGKLYKRDFLLAHRLNFVVNMKKAQDAIFNLYALEKAVKVLYINKILYHYRINEASICQRYNPNVPEILKKFFSEVDGFINIFHKGVEFRQAYYCAVVDRFAEILKLDIIHKNNPSSFRERLQRLILITKDKEYEQAFKMIDMNSLNIKKICFCWCYKKNMFFCSLFVG